MCIYARGREKERVGKEGREKERGERERLTERMNLRTAATEMPRESCRPICVCAFVLCVRERVGRERGGERENYELRERESLGWTDRERIV